MSTVQTVRLFVQQRLDAAAEEIFELFERTIAEYEEKLLEARYMAEVRIHRADDQEEEKPPELLHVKEEQEEVQAGLEGDHILISGVVSADIDPCQDQEALPSELDQSPTGEDGDAGFLEAEELDDGGSQSDMDQDSMFPDLILPHLSDADTDYSCYDWDHREPGSDVDQDAGGGPGSKKKKSNVQAGGKMFSCPFCGKGYRRKSFLRRHIRIHTGRSRFSCSLCGQGLKRRRDLLRHMKVHDREEPCKCPVSSTSTSGRLHHPSCSHNSWVDQFQVPWDKMREALRKAVSKGLRPEAEDRRDMVKVVAASMREYSLNPSRKDCTMVANAIVQKYPDSFLDKNKDGEIVGCGYVSLLNQLKTRIEYVIRRSRLQKPQQGDRQDQNPGSKTRRGTSGVSKEKVDIFSREALKASEGGDVNELITCIQNKVE